MAAFHILCASAIFLILTSHSLVIASSIPSDNSTVRGIYYPSWGKLKPSAINTAFYTHIYYAFLVPNNRTFKFDIDTTTQTQLRSFNSILHAKDPPVRTLFSIGGGAADPTLFARMASDKLSRAAFINSSIDVARTCGFDGFDLDWEFPENKEIDDFATLLKEWRAAVQKDNKVRKGQQPFLITAAVYYSARRNNQAFPADSIRDNLDMINVMNYDYRGSWDTSATGEHAALFDPRSNNVLSTDHGIKSWIDAGVPSKKVNMGFAMFGKEWRLRDPAQHGVGAPAVGMGPDANPADGTMTYAQVVAFNKNHTVKGVFDKSTVSMYSVWNTSWIGYDDPTSVGFKVVYARALDLRGYFFWEINQDYKSTISKAALDSW